MASRHDPRAATARGAAARLLPALLLTAALVVPLSQPRAQMLCSKPLQPLCSTDVQTLADEAEKQRCRDDADRYLEELGDYRGCLAEATASAERSLEKAKAFRSCLDDGGDSCRLEADSNL